MWLWHHSDLEHLSVCLWRDGSAFGNVAHVLTSYFNSNRTVIVRIVRFRNERNAMLPNDLLNISTMECDAGHGYDLSQPLLLCLLQTTPVVSVKILTRVHLRCVVKSRIFKPLGHAALAHATFGLQLLAYSGVSPAGGAGGGLILTTL